MKEIWRPRGLIDYATPENAQRAQAGTPPVPELKMLRHPRARTGLTIAPARDPVRGLESDGALRNGMAARFENTEICPRAMTWAIEGLPAPKFQTDAMDASDAVRLLSPMLPADATLPLRICVTAPRASGRETENRCPTCLQS